MRCAPLRAGRSPYRLQLGRVNANGRIICYAGFIELTDAQYAMLSPLLPVQRGNVKIKNRQLLHALLYIAENGCKW